MEPTPREGSMLSLSFFRARARAACFCSASTGLPLSSSLRSSLASFPSRTISLVGSAHTLSRSPRLPPPCPLHLPAAGWDGRRSVSVVERLELGSGCGWFALPSLRHARHYVSSAQLRGAIYVLGGACDSIIARTTERSGSDSISRLDRKHGRVAPPRPNPHVALRVPPSLLKTTRQAGTIGRRPGIASAGNPRTGVGRKE